MIYVYGLREIGKTEQVDFKWVGQTCNPKSRLNSHRNNMRGQNKEKIDWISSINKNIEMIILETTDEKNAYIVEQKHMDRLRNIGCLLFNKKPASNCGRGYHLNEETRRKISESGKISQNTPEIKERKRITRLGQTHTEETKFKMRLFRLGKSPSQETKNKISLTLIGNKHSVEQNEKQRQVMIGNNYALGNKLSSETKRKMSLAQMGKIIPEYVKNKISKALIGKKFTEEHKNKLRKPKSKEVKSKISKILTGRKLSEEHKNKIKKTILEKFRKGVRYDF